MEKKKNQGLTLIELLIIIFLIGVLSYLSLPNFKTFSRYSSLKKEAWEILSDLRTYRQLAIIQHYNYRFDFDINNDSYTIEQRDPATDAYLQTMETVTLNNNIVSATDTTFQPEGNAVPASTIVLQSKNASETINIILYSSTGLAKMTE